MTNSIQYTPTPIESYLPYPAIFFISNFCKVHSFFKGTKRIIHIAQDPLNMLFSAFGAGLNYTLGSFSFIRFPARAVLVAKRVVECVEAQNKLIRSYQKLQLSFSEYVYNENLSKRGMFSYSLLSKLEYLGLKIQIIFKRFMHFFSHLFVLSSSYIALVESFTQNPSDEAVEDFFINSRYFFNQLKVNEQSIYATLNSLGVSYSISNLTNSLSATFKVCGFVAKTFDTITQQAHYTYKFLASDNRVSLFEPQKLVNKPKIGLCELYRIQAKQDMPYSTLQGLMK
jgi:hypothetical protein